MRLWVVCSKGANKRQVFLSEGCQSERAYEVVWRAALDVCSEDEILRDVLCGYCDLEDPFRITAEEDSIMAKIQKLETNEVYCEVEHAALRQGIHLQNWD
jgi:hypothetical protein